MSSVRPARRFDALRALAGPGLPSRLSPDGGPPCAFALLQRSIAAPPHRPANPKVRMSNDASSPGLSCPTTHPERRTRISRGFRPHCVPRPGFGYPHRGVHHRPSRRLSAPERPWASPFKAFSSRRSAPLPECPALVAFPASIRLTPMGSVRTRPRSGPRSRRRARSAIPSPEGPGAPMPSWASSLQSVPSPRPTPPLRIAGDPFTRVGRFDVPARLRHKVFRLEEIGCPLSGMPALVGFFTFRPSRHRGDRGGGRAHGFASRLVRVASGANRSKPPR